MDKLEAMRVFITVAECESFVKASLQLEISAPAVTRAIAKLEQRLDAKLFTRTTRHVRLTDVGHRFLQDAKRILEEIDQAEAAVSGSYTKPAGSLSITAPVLFGQKHIVPIVSEYLDLHPAVNIKLVLLDRVTHLMEEGLDIAIRLGHLEDSSLYARQVGSVERVICGSPEYFAKNGRPQTPNDLQNHQIISTNIGEFSHLWRLKAEEKHLVKLKPRLQCNHMSGAINAALEGTGLIRVLSYQIGEYIADGRLERVLEPYDNDRLPVSIVYLESRRANAKISAFVDFAAERLGRNPFIQQQALGVE